RGHHQHLAPRGLAHARPDNPIQLPSYPDKPRIPSGLQPETGPRQLSNCAQDVNEPVRQTCAKRYDVADQRPTQSTLHEAVAKLAAGAAGYDVFVSTQPEISLLVAGKLIQPLNLNYIPNLRKNVWKMLQSPWYDVGSRYTVPYTVFSTGIGWRNDFLPDYDPSKLANPYDSFWGMEEISGRVGMLDDQREGL